LNKLKIIIALGYMVVVLAGCSPEDSDIPITENETFNEFLKNTPATIIDLDEISIDTVKITSNQMLGTESSFFSEPVYLQPPMTSIMKQRDSIYTVNRQKIFVMDKNGVWKRSVGGKGNGPGEYDSYVNIAGNSSMIFGFDYGNGRIQIYDTELKLTSSYAKQLHHPLNTKNYSVNHDRLYIGLSPYQNDHLVGIYSVNDIENVVETFWPKVIPNGLQPAPYNSIIIDVNTKDIIAITNLGLPYLFLLSSDLIIEHILYFDSSYYEELENPSAKPLRIAGNTHHDVPGVGAFIQNLQLDDDGSLYLTVGNNLYKIIIDETNSYKLKKGWHFVHNDPVLRKNSAKGISITTMAIEEGLIYFLSNWGGEYVFRVLLEE